MQDEQRPAPNPHLSTPADVRESQRLRLVGLPDARATSKLNVELTLRIRPCTEADLDHLEWFGAFTHDRSIIRDTFDSQKSGQTEMLVVDLSGFPVGQLWLDLARPKAGVGLLWALRVFPFLRGQGIGTKLIEHAEARLRTRGLVEAEIGVELDNGRARKLYERLGYRHVRDERLVHAYVLPNGAHAESLVIRAMLRKRL